MSGVSAELYPMDVREEEWWFVLPCLLLCLKDAVSGGMICVRFLAESST
jgi:hypothetical protein